MSTISDPGPFARELLHKLDLKPPIDVFFICDNFNIIIKNDNSEILKQFSYYIKAQKR